MELLKMKKKWNEEKRWNKKREIWRDEIERRNFAFLWISKEMYVSWRFANHARVIRVLHFIHDASTEYRIVCSTDGKRAVRTSALYGYKYPAMRPFDFSRYFKVFLREPPTQPRFPVAVLQSINCCALKGSSMPVCLKICPCILSTIE